ncbi:N-methylhydantoinase B [Paraburkholderia piptadeniae]|uniref:N-methylhydantoinase B n=1 Tax=Paraburkholderia piptadeniae TaxID=1701573 RepID=A0A1N7SPX1_9BURK|nr:hydantoinase B/oxoprolinase family protein [Paraburkholderia piptadeniae]SIT49370.1 N-methylhydantoinase B [Paraburkholderia piptadeniae]
MDNHISEPGSIASATDSITVSVIGSALATIVDEMSRVLVKAGYSTSIKERKDVSTAIMDPGGLIIAQAAHQPAHLGSLLGITRRLLETYSREDIQPGDVFIGNDAYEGGGTHLNDIVFIEPVFIDGEIRAWITNIAHHADFVERGHAHIFQEGLRIPPVRLYAKGELQKEVLDLILLNCQVPRERVNDFRAQKAANIAGMNRFVQLCEKYTYPVVREASVAILDHTEKRTRAGIRKIANGTYSYAGLLDSGRYDSILELKVSIEVRDEDIIMDFRGNPSQVRGPINLTYMGLLATVYYAVKVLVDPDVPANAGFQRPITVLADPGTIVCSSAPAAVYSRTDTAERLCDLIFSALAPAVPEYSLAASTGRGLLTLSGIDPRSGRYYVYNESMGGGEGAHMTRDGATAVQTAVSNSHNIPVEVVEAEYPLQIVSYELATDSGGAGKWRGGLSYRRKLRVMGHEAKAAIAGNCLREPSWGLDGGLPGSLGARETSADVEPFVNGRGVVSSGQTVAFTPSGGGGYGDPRDRDPELVKRDVREGKVSREVAREVYGVSEV